MIALLTTAPWCVALTLLAPPDEGTSSAPAPAPTAAQPADQPAEVVVRTDPLDKPPPPKPVAPPEPEREPTTDHYGIPSRASDKNEFPKRAAAPKTAPPEEALVRDTDVELEAEGKPTGSPQRFAFEFKIGPYLPAVDRRYEGAGLGPYATIFGRTNSGGVAIDQPKLGVMPALAFEWQFLYAAGPLGIGTQVGFFRDKAKALLAQPVEGDDTVRSAADDATFGIVPLALTLNYRFEFLADRLGVPLVPYAKGGLAYAFWWSRDGNGDISRNSQDEAGRGGVAGWQANAGLMLRLDFIEPTLARTFDQLSGINHTYLFGEFQMSRIANFGVGNAIALGDATWFAGMAIEF